MLASVLTCAKTYWSGDKLPSGLAVQKLAKHVPADSQKLYVALFTGWLIWSCSYGVHMVE